MTYGITHLERTEDGAFRVADRPMVVMGTPEAFGGTYYVTCLAQHVHEVLAAYEESDVAAQYGRTNIWSVGSWYGASMAQGAAVSYSDVRIVTLPALSTERTLIGFPWGNSYFHGGMVIPTYTLHGPWVWAHSQCSHLMLGGLWLFGALESMDLAPEVRRFSHDIESVVRTIPLHLRWGGNNNEGEAMPENNEGEAMPEGEDVPENTENNAPIPNTLDCEWCGSTNDEDDMQYVGDGVDGYLCPYCQDEARYCVRCDTAGTADTMIVDNDGYPRYGTRYYCEYCWDEQEGERTTTAEVHSYSYKPSPLFYDDSPNGVVFGRQAELNTLYMGVELELEYGSCRDQRGVVEDMKSCGERLGGAEFWYGKHDGSISDGFEAVSHPATLAAWREADLGWLERAADAGCRAWNTSTCGLHIHLSLSAFDSRAHFARWWILHERNSADWVRLAGRHSRTYASWDRAIDGQAVRRAYGVFPHDPFNSPFAPPAPDYYNDSRETIERKEFEREMFRKYRSNNKLAHLGERNYERYTAINVQNTHTAEQRFWRPSLRANTLLATLEAVQAAFDYTRALSALDSKATMKEKIELLSWSDFRAWVDVHTADYPYLDARIAARFGEADEQADD